MICPFCGDEDYANAYFDIDDEGTDVVMCKACHEVIPISEYQALEEAEEE